MTSAASSAARVRCVRVGCESHAAALDRYERGALPLAARQTLATDDPVNARR